ncbi:hypothetical protein D5H75_36800 [Bailinhaonella thermotolerans]|uniref:Uncharacterized protein n=1 Tax=Bailinhaonella thermotolerans TaxID=1070861 RepID=A0A3A4AQF0_9ACTN|nr:hypothetical protein D5H75_36800 [Bailinhaonella thermotolerans]
MRAPAGEPARGACQGVAAGRRPPSIPPIRGVARRRGKLKDMGPDFGPPGATVRILSVIPSCVRARQARRTRRSRAPSGPGPALVRPCPGPGRVLAGSGGSRWPGPPGSWPGPAGAGGPARRDHGR